MFDGNPCPDQATPRQCWMALLARSSADELEGLVADGPALPPCAVLRPPEAGSIMVQGRVGGTGAPFNLGEASVARCAVQCGPYVGHAYVLGRDLRHARLAAELDAALQDEALRPSLERSVLAPLRERQDARRAARAARAAATQVEFFTLATMRS